MLCGAAGVPGTGGPGRPRAVRAAWPASLGLAAVCAGGRRLAREIATRELRSEWSISRPALALPPPTGTATKPIGGASKSHPDPTSLTSSQALAALIPAPTTNFARNSPTTTSNFEFRSLELQRFWALLKLQLIELRASFLEATPCHHPPAPQPGPPHRSLFP